MKIYEQNCFAIKSCFPAAFLLSLSHCCVTESKWCTEREKKVRLSTPSNFLFESSFHIQMELKSLHICLEVLCMGILPCL